MATATQKDHAGTPRARGADTRRARGPLAFSVSEDNGGDYLWEIVDSGGNTVAQSGGFASRQDAERAAHYVHDSARLAHFGPRETEEPV